MWRFLKQLHRSRRAPAGPRFVVHRRYLLDLPFPQYDASRPFRILAYLEKRKLLKRGVLRRPRAVSLRRLKGVHDESYLRSLENPGAIEPILGFPVDPHTQDKFLCFQRMVCGGTLNAARNALRHHGTSINLGGGFHHAAPASGSGFCVFNDVAVAIDSLRRRGFVDPILVVDLDLHDGDGTRAFFVRDPTVHTFSIHNRDLGDPSGTATTSIALGADVDDDRYLGALRESLPGVVARLRPGFVFYLAGSDPGIEDKLGDWRISMEGMLERDRFVMGQVPPGTPCVILLAGGYGRRTWRHGAAFLSWLLTGDANLDIPLELELPVDHYRRLTRLMKNPRRRESTCGSDPAKEDLDWGLSNRDLGLGGARRPDLFLNLFSRHALEMALEESGLLDRLRHRGYESPRLSLDLDDPAGHTLRLLTDEENPEAVVEIKLRIDRTSEPGSSYLKVEWLLIQDAAGAFEMSRPLLPGQNFPGLGLLGDVAAVLVVLCERLHLDGLVFTPSHYHLASLSRPAASDRDPRREGRFQAIEQAVRGMRLREAALAVHDGRVIDRQTGEPLRWDPAPLTIPVSSACRRYFESEDYRLEVARALSSFEFKLSEMR